MYNRYLLSTYIIKSKKLTNSWSLCWISLSQTSNSMRSVCPISSLLFFTSGCSPPSCLTNTNQSFSKNVPSLRLPVYIIKRICNCQGHVSVLLEQKISKLGMISPLGMIKDSPIKNTNFFYWIPKKCIQVRGEDKRFRVISKPFGFINKG